MEVNFHLPGLRQNFPLNMLFVNFLETQPEFFREGVKIASFFGEFPTSLWNGGRVSNYDQCDASFVKNVIKAVNGKGIPIRYTYTNMLLNEEDLKDPYCNFCMRAADNGMNEVMIFSPILEKYIRENYPGYKLNSSTCKEIRDIDLVNKELEKDYYMVVLDYNFNGRFEELEKIGDKGRCEILVNALCSPACPRRGKHYENIAKNQRILLKNRCLRINRSLWMPGIANMDNTIQSMIFRTTAPIFLLTRYGRNMFPWAFRISSWRDARAIPLIWWRPTAII